MKKILFLLLLITTAMNGQTGTGNEAEFDYGIKNNAAQTVTTSDFITTTGTNGTQGKILGENISLSVIPPVTHFTPLTANIKGYFQGIDNALGDIVATTAGNTTRVWFTGDATTIGAGTFYLSNATGKGTVANVSQSVINDDNQKKYFTQDVIGQPFASNTLFPPGVYAGNLSASTTPNSAQQRFTVELYKCDNNGTPIASGVSGAPVGDLGVTVILILDSGLLTLVDGSVTNVPVSASLASQFSIATGERIRYHISAEKVGTASSNITESVWYGTSFNSYLDVPTPITSSGVSNLSTVTGSTVTVALDNLNTGKENVSNKATDFTTVNDTLYPTVQATKTYADAVNHNGLTNLQTAQAGVTYGHVTDGAQTIAGVKTFSPTVSATANLARGTIFTPSLTSTANNDVLVGLDINPTFNIGAFTNVSRVGLRIGGDAIINGFINGSSTKVLPSGLSTSTHTLNLTQTDATSAFTRSTDVIFNEDGITSTSAIRLNQFATVINKTTNQPSSLYQNLVSQPIQGGSGSIGTIYGIISTLLGSGTGAVTTVRLFSGNLSPFNNAFPITTYTGLYLGNNPQNNVTNGRGIEIGDLFGSTLSRGIDIGVSSGTGKFNIYSQGTAPNYFAAALLVGTTTSNGNAFRLTGTAELITTPTTSAGGYGIITRNSSTGVLEQVASANGTYTPTLSNTTNVSGATLVTAMYTRVGSIVTVTIALNATVTASSTFSKITLTLPIARVSSSVLYSGSASGWATTYYAGAVALDANTTTASLEFIPANTGTNSFAATFSYKVD